MAKKEFKYRGMSLEELQALSREEVIKLIPSRTRRTLLRGYDEACKIAQARILEGDNVKTHCREIVIMPKMVGKTVHVHNGKNFEQVLIQPEMIGHVLGEFALTRAMVKHGSAGVGATKSSSAVSVR